MRIQAGDIFVNSLEGLLFSTPLLLSSINARAAAKGSSLWSARGLRAAVRCARRRGPKARTWSRSAKTGMTEDQIASILQIRRRRSEVFGEGLFSDPAWDILLELFAAQLRQRRLELTDLESIAPTSTLARWVAVLQERGLVICELDALCPDRFWIALSGECAAEMSAFLNAAPDFVRSP